MIKVDSAKFEALAEPPIPEWIIGVTVKGSGFEQRAMLLRAQVGNLPIEGLMIDLDGNGFTGFLSGEPGTGDHLSVGISEMIDTGITYQPDNV